MPIVSKLMSAQMTQKGSSLELTGDKLMSFVDAVSMACTTYVVGSSFVNSTNQVTGPGAGTYTATLKNLNAPVMSGLMMSQAAPAELGGRDLKKFFDALSHGVVQALKSAVSTGSVIGGGPGIGRGSIKNLVPEMLEASIITQLGGKQLAGEKMPKLASCIAFGVCNHLMQTVFVSTTCVGAFAGPPAGPVLIPAAVGTGKIA